MTSVLEEWSPHVNEPPLVWYEEVLHCGSRYSTYTGAVIEVPRIGRGWQGDRKMSAWVITTAAEEARRRKNGWFAESIEAEDPKNIAGSVQDALSLYIAQGALRLP